ncbi:14-3-3-like protein GF14-12 isoform X2 [Zingiber officinale]|nr:14-3-3-like protein GF14-12 isoform X2 [Zingiber officinale]
MKGDYYRHLIELKTESQCKDAIDNTLSFYKTALAELAPLNPIRLQLAVDFSTFYYDVLKSLQMTCTLVDQAINDATRDMAAQLSIIQVLHDKVDSWRSELVVFLFILKLTLYFTSANLVF